MLFTMILKNFKNIAIGGISGTELQERLRKADIHFNEYAEILFQDPLFEIDPILKKVTLAKVNLTGLSLEKSSTFEEIVRAAKECELNLCPMFLAAFLRLEYLDQPEGPYLTIASKKPISEEKYPCGFYLRNLDGKLWLRGYFASDDYLWPIVSEFIFISGEQHEL